MRKAIEAQKATNVSQKYFCCSCTPSLGVVDSPSSNQSFQVRPGVELISKLFPLQPNRMNLQEPPWHERPQWNSTCWLIQTMWQWLSIKHSALKISEIINQDLVKCGYSLAYITLKNTNENPVFGSVNVPPWGFFMFYNIPDYRKEAEDFCFCSARQRQNNEFWEPSLSMEREHQSCQLVGVGLNVSAANLSILMHQPVALLLPEN